MLIWDRILSRFRHWDRGRIDSPALGPLSQRLLYKLSVVDLVVCLGSIFPGNLQKRGCTPRMRLYKICSVPYRPVDCKPASVKISTVRTLRLAYLTEREQGLAYDCRLLCVAKSFASMMAVMADWTVRVSEELSKSVSFFSP